MGADSTLSTFVALDGDNIAVQDWPLEQGEPVRGVVLLVHGLGEYAGRYDALASQLNDWGFAVRGYDQYGHGESGGLRGALPTESRLLDDLADMVDSIRARMDHNLPLILLGHSLGGLVAARFVALAMRPVQALVLSSPAFALDLDLVQKCLLAVLPAIAPDWRISRTTDPSRLTHDRQVVAAYRADPLIHHRLSGRLARFLVQTGPATVALAAAWTVPTLLLYAGADQVVNPAGSRAFAAAAPKAVVTAQCFDDLFHELFNELHPEPVYAALKQWLDLRFASTAAPAHASPQRRAAHSG